MVSILLRPNIAKYQPLIYGTGTIFIIEAETNWPTFSDAIVKAFSSIEHFDSQIKFHCNMFLRMQYVPYKQNGRHYAVNVFRRVSLKFVPKGPIDNKLSLIHIMVWRQTDTNSGIIWNNGGLGCWHIYASFVLNDATHWGLMTHICGRELGHHWFKSRVWSWLRRLSWNC